MTYYIGKDSYVGIKKQAAAGTAETTATIFVPVEEMPSLQSEAGNVYAKEYRANYAEINNVYRGAQKSEGSITFPAYPEMLTYALYGIYGTASSSVVSDSAYTHTYTEGATLPIWTLFVGSDSLAVEKYHDMTMKELKIKIETDKAVSCEASFIGASHDIITAALTPSYGTQRALMYSDAQVSLGGAPACDVETMDLTISRGVKDGKKMCTTGLGATEPNMVYPTTMQIEGSITQYFTGYDEVKYWFGKSDATSFKTDTYSKTDAKRAFQLTLTGGLIGVTSRDLLTLAFANMYYDNVKIDRSFDDRIKATYDFKAGFDGTHVSTCSMVSKVVDVDA